MNQNEPVPRAFEPAFWDYLEWVFKVGVPLTMVLVTVLAVALSSRDKKLTRVRYAVRATVATLLMALLILVIPRAVQGGHKIDTITPLFCLLVAFVVSIVLVIWSVHRLQDIGWSRWIGLVMGVPVVSFAMMVMLIAWPGGQKGHDT